MGIRRIPNVVTYNTTITACEKGNQWELALKLFETAPIQGVVPDLITYNATISACGRCQQWETALRLFELLLRRGFEPSHVTYDAIINACERSNKNDIVRNLCQDRHERQSRSSGAIEISREPPKTKSQQSSFSREERTSRKPTYEEVAKPAKIAVEEEAVSLEQFLPMSGKTAAGLKQVKQTPKVTDETDNLLDFALASLSNTSRMKSPPREIMSSRSRDDFFEDPYSEGARSDKRGRADSRDQGNSRRSAADSGVSRGFSIERPSKGDGGFSAERVAPFMREEKNRDRRAANRSRSGSRRRDHGGARTDGRRKPSVDDAFERSSRARAESPPTEVLFDSRNMKDSPPPVRKAVELKPAKSSSKAPKSLSDVFEDPDDDGDAAWPFGKSGGPSKRDKKKVAVASFARLEVKNKPAPPLLAAPAAPVQPPPMEEMATDADLDAICGEAQEDMTAFFSSRDTFELVD